MARRQRTKSIATASAQRRGGREHGKTRRGTGTRDRRRAAGAPHAGIVDDAELLHDVQTDLNGLQLLSQMHNHVLTHLHGLIQRMQQHAGH